MFIIIRRGAAKQDIANRLITHVETTILFSLDFYRTNMAVPVFSVNWSRIDSTSSCIGLFPIHILT